VYRVVTVCDVAVSECAVGRREPMFEYVFEDVDNISVPMIRCRGYRK